MTFSNKYDSIEQLIIESDLKITKLGIDKQNDLMIITLNSGVFLLSFISRFKRLSVATDEQLANYRLIGSGIGIHWPDLDEDLSLKGFLKDELKKLVTTGRAKSDVFSSIA